MHFFLFKKIGRTKTIIFRTSRINPGGHFRGPPGSSGAVLKPPGPILGPTSFFWAPEAAAPKTPADSARWRDRGPNLHRFSHAWGQRSQNACERRSGSTFVHWRKNKLQRFFLLCEKKLRAAAFFHWRKKLQLFFAL